MHPRNYVETAKHFILQFPLYTNKRQTVMPDISIIGQLLNQNEDPLFGILPFSNDSLYNYEKFLTTECKDSLHPI